MRKINILSITALFIFAAVLGFLYSRAQAEEARKLFLFYSPGCNLCTEAKAKLIPYIEEKFRGRIFIEYLDLSDVENYKLMIGLQKKYEAKPDNTLPIFFMEGRFISGAQSLSSLSKFISEGLAKEAEKSTGYWPKVDLADYFKSFGPLAVIGAGLIDGINPCAFTVIVFFISFLALQGYKRRELIIIGLSFIAAVFFTYVFIGVGIFAFLYRLQGFILASKIINAGIGVLSISLGGCAIYDIIKFRKTQDSEGLILQLPQAIKKRIQKVVGQHYRKHGVEAGNKGIFALVLSALITGFLVSLLEAVCTGQTYLPTIGFVLKMPQLRMHALAYLLIYNLMFILPLLAVFCLALLGITSGQFAGFLKKRLTIVKALMAAVFFILGFSLLYPYLPQRAPSPESSRVAILIEKPAPLLPVQEEKSWDFGVISEGDVVRHTFSFKNNSDRVISIKDVTTSCGCAASEAGKKMLKPHEDTTIDVVFDSKGYSGDIRQYVYVYTDDSENPVVKFTIKAMVIR